MMFYESGVYPGVPGQFSHCTVTVSSDGQVLAEPLAQQPHIPTADDTAETDEKAPEQAEEEVA